jgi:2-polyprenyl-3-methyl-5-hydroxy-6-metoxy-1,4-benzoquinol methylase
MNIIQSTISFYDKKASELVKQYETANMSELHTFLLKSLLPSSKVLDIGFGSGRDLSFLREHGFDVWGIDPSEKFVKYAKKRFSDLENHFYKAALPTLEGIPNKLLHSFDNIILIAVLMHIPQKLHCKTIQSILSLLKPEGRIVLSYSVTPRTEKMERYFEDINIDLLHKLFEDEGCSLISSISNQDGLGEREIIWVTEAYSYDKL